MMPVSITLWHPSPNLHFAGAIAQVGMRPRRAAARDRGAQAPSFSRPAVGPPAHVVARAALESGSCGDVRVAARLRTRGAHSGNYGTTKIAKEQRGRVNGGEGCKIKGGLARVRQALERFGVFDAYARQRRNTGLATRAQALIRIEDLSYPAGKVAGILEELP